MSKFAVYQLKLTRAESDRVNELGSWAEAEAENPKIAAYQAMRFSERFEARFFKFYDKVAVVTVDGDEESVFMVMNRWSDKDKDCVERLAPLHSLSVGDIVENLETGEMKIVADFGFNQISVMNTVVGAEA